MAKTQINVKKPFMLQMRGADGKPMYLKYKAGAHMVEQEVADHWYTKVHLHDHKQGELDEFQLAVEAAVQARLKELQGEEVSDGKGVKVKNVEDLSKDQQEQKEEDDARDDEDEVGKQIKANRKKGK